MYVKCLDEYLHTEMIYAGVANYCMLSVLKCVDLECCVVDCI